MNQFHHFDNDNFIAYKQYKSNDTAPWIVFIHGMMSNMNGKKSVHLENFCQTEKLNFVAFDNYGHGQSSGVFLEQTITTWLKAVQFIINMIKSNNIILVGSSLGGWLALLAAIEHSNQVKGVVGLATAADFTQNLIWDALSDKEKKCLQSEKYLDIKHKDFDSSFRLNYQLILDGKNYLVLNKNKMEVACPIHCIHGLLDKEVPYQISAEIIEKVQSNHAVLKLIKHADHRISDPDSLLIMQNSIKEIIKLL